MWHDIAKWLGLTDGSGPYYLFWSGFFGAVEGLGGLGILFLAWRVFECHADGCHRPGLHHVHGTRFKTCRRHHPEDGNSVEDIHAAYHEARAKRV